MTVARRGRDEKPPMRGTERTGREKEPRVREWERVACERRNEPGVGRSPV